MKKLSLLSLLIILVLSASQPAFAEEGVVPLEEVFIPSESFVFTGPCAELDQETPQSDACDAYMAANPVPEFIQPIEYDEARDGQAISRAIMLPDEPMPLPVAWMKRNWYFMDGPGILPAADDWGLDRLVERYNMFYIYNAIEADGAWWFLIGPGKWMKEDYLSVLQLPEVPRGVSGQWMTIDLQQQTLIVFKDERPVFATLVSTGYWLDTTEGLFQIYGRTLSMRMTGPPGANPPVYDFRTRWAMFFNVHQAVHSANFHNQFGLQRTHGCINMVPGDVEWLWHFFDQTSEAWDPSGGTSFRVDFPEKSPFVMVYQGPRYPSETQWG